MKIIKNLSLSATMILTIGITACNQNQDSCQVSDLSGIVEQQKMDVLYVGIKNAIKVSVPGYCPADIQVSLTNGDLTKEKPGHYTIEVMDNEQTKLSIVAKEGENQTKQIGERTYKIKQLPEPTPHIAGKTSGKIKASKIENTTKISIKKAKGSPIQDINYRIAGYRFTYVPKKGNFQETSVKKATFDSTINKIKKDLNAGDRVIVDKIRIAGPKKGFIRDLSSSINLKIAEEQNNENGKE